MMLELVGSIVFVGSRGPMEALYMQLVDLSLAEWQWVELW
jgi:hypothetical protein